MHRKIGWAGLLHAKPWSLLACQVDFHGRALQHAAAMLSARVSIRLQSVTRPPVQRQAVRAFVNGRFTLPTPSGEPFLDYAPGSPERATLQAELLRVRSQTVEIPCIVDGKSYFTGDTFTQLAPSDHSAVLAKVHRATPAVVDAAMYAWSWARRV